MEDLPDDYSDSLERMWEGLLSRLPEKVRATYAKLSPSDQKAVRLHLQRMAGEPGWHPEQRISAQAALDAIEQIAD